MKTGQAYRCSFVLLLAGCHKSGPPYTSAEAIKTFQIDPAFRVEPFASEPAIVSPVAMDFDENGRVFVVENRGPKLGRVKLLEDTNGDGIPDRSTIFADNLTMPTGVMRWKKGILVTDAPDVLYFEDSKGDGKADIRRVALTGFAAVNNPIYGLDNWIYLARETAGTGGSDPRFPDRPEVPPLTDRDHNVRFRLDTHQIEALSGSSQFGQAFDEWGHHFTVANSDHIRQEVIAARYLKRNPDLHLSSAMAQISDHGSAGEFTSARGPVFFNGAMFVAEPANNLVHEDVLFEAGAASVAKRAREGTEFLSSTDAWFRPMNLSTGPDGALYLMDLYGLTAGIDRGRIYRITPRVADRSAPKIGPPGSASIRELVHALESVNPWRRRTAQRLLVDRNQIEAAPELGRLVETSLSPVGRVHALWTLDGMKKLDVRLILKALDDAEPGVRENALILAEPRLAESAALAARLLETVEDTSPKVRFQLLCTLGFLNTPEARNARDRLLAEDIEDRWVQAAALSASSDDAPRLFAKALADWSYPESAGRASLFRQICSAIGARKKGPELQQALSRISEAGGHGAAWWREASLEGLAQGMRSSGPTGLEALRPLLPTLFSGPDAGVRRASLPLLEMAGLPPGRSTDEALKRAEAIAQDSSADPELRADQIALLAVAIPELRRAMFEALIDPKQPEEVQTAAVEAFGKIKGDDAGRALLVKWRALTGPARTAAADAMYLEPSRVKLLVAALQTGEVQPWTLSFGNQRRLILHADPAIREAARPLLDPGAGERQKVLDRYEAALDKKPDPQRGREMFRSTALSAIGCKASAQRWVRTWRPCRINRRRCSSKV